MQLQHSNALMRSCVDGCFTKFTCLLTLCTLSQQTYLALLAVSGKQTSSVNDVIRYERMIDILFIVFIKLQVRKISGIFPKKFRKVSDILFFPEKLQPYLS